MATGEAAPWSIRQLEITEVECCGYLEEEETTQGVRARRGHGLAAGSRLRQSAAAYLRHRQVAVER